MAGFSWFQMVSAGFRQFEVVSGAFRSFLVLVNMAVSLV